jgi:hypothetical protein
MQGVDFEVPFQHEEHKGHEGARCAPHNHNESMGLGARPWRAFVSFVLFVFPLQLLPDWVPAFAGMSGFVGEDAPA